MKVQWSRLALRDLDSALDYIKQTNPDGVATVRGRIEASLAALSRHPKIGRAGRVKGTRELVVVGTPFVIAYRIAPDTIEIVGMLHGARQWPDRF